MCISEVCFNSKSSTNSHWMALSSRSAVSTSAFKFSRATITSGIGKIKGGTGKWPPVPPMKKPKTSYSLRSNINSESGKENWKIRGRSCAPYLQLLKYQMFKNSVHGTSPNQDYQAAIQFKYWDTVSSYRAYIPDVINSTHKLVVVGGNKRLPHIISAASLTLVICVLSVMTWKVKQGWSIFPASNERKCVIYIYIYISQKVWRTSKSSQRLPQVEAAIAM